MRRGIFVLLCLVLAVSMAAIPADTISARSASSLELSAPSPAQLEKEKDQVDKILDELKLARGYTDDKKIRGQIDDISNMIKTAWKYEKAGDTELALAMKVKAAKFLDDLIGELPAASPGMTTAAAAMPEENPLYEELVRVWGKIIVLIDMELERVPEGVTPLIPEIQRVTEPEIKRPPEMERLIVYSAKFLCGPAFGGEGVQPGSYSTAINVHNPYNQTVYLYKKAVIAEPEYKPRGQISAFRKVVLRADEAIEIDCLDIGSFFRPQPEPRKPTEEGRPSLTLTPTYAENMVGEHHKLVATVRDANGNPVAGAEVSFHLLETGSTPVRPTDGNGQALLEYSSPEEHKDTIVATVTVNGHKLEAQATKVWTSKPTEEAQCPQGCECMTETQASVDNLALCQNQRIQCGSAVSTTTTATAATTVPMYCYEKPPGEVGCPQGCFCTDPGKADEEGLEWCLRNGDEIPCGGNQYCFREPTGQPTSECPAGCECLTEDALQQGYTWCEGVRRQCGYDEYQNDMFCFQKPSGTSRLTNVAMAMPEETGLTAPSEQTGTTLSTSGLPIRELYRPTRFIKGFVVIYSTAPLDVVGVYTASTAFGFSLDVEYLQPSTRGVVPIPIPEEPEEPPPTEAECPYPCECLTKDEAYQRYGPNAAMCQDKPCGYDAQRNVDKYCWKPAEEGRPSLTLKPSYDENMVGENHTVTAIVTKNGSPVPGVDVQFQLVEPDSVHSDKLGMLTKTTDAAGQATGFNYSGDKEGKDIIVASATVDGYDLKAQATKLWTSKPTEEAECPQRCECRTRAEAAELGLVLCQGPEIVCAYDDNQRPLKYCFQKPEEPPPTTTECPYGCFCMFPQEAGDREWCLRNGDEIPCGQGRYCFREPEELTPTEIPCPSGCYCWTVNEGQGRGYDWCQGRQIECAWDQNQRPTKYCFQPPQEEPTPTYESCPRECDCMTYSAAQKLGYQFCDPEGHKIQCGPDQYCFRKPPPILRLK